MKDYFSPLIFISDRTISSSLEVLLFKINSKEQDALICY